MLQLPERTTSGGFVRNFALAGAFAVLSMIEYEAGNYRDAMWHWELLLKELRTGSEEQRQLSAAIARARELSEGR